MSFLMWLSFLIVALMGFRLFGWSLIELQGSFASASASSFLRSSLVMFGRSLLLIDREDFLLRLMRAQDEKTLTRRGFLFALAVINLTSLLPLVVLGTLLLRVNSHHFLLMGALMWALSRWQKDFYPWAVAAFGLALVLLGSEFAVRQSALVFASTLEIPWLFTLGSSLWSSILVALSVATVSAMIFPTPGVGLLVGSLLVLVGLASLPVGLALCLGEPLAFWIGSFFNSRKSGVEREILFRALLFLATLLILYTCFEWGQRAVELLLPGPYSPGLRFRQLLVMLVSFCGIETMLSLVFFHFRHVKST